MKFNIVNKQDKWRFRISQWQRTPLTRGIHSMNVTLVIWFGYLNIKTAFWATTIIFWTKNIFLEKGRCWEWSGRGRSSNTWISQEAVKPHSGCQEQKQAWGQEAIKTGFIVGIFLHSTTNVLWFSPPYLWCYVSICPTVRQCLVKCNVFSPH